MAGLEIHQAFLSHRKVLRLARLLHIDKYEVAGRMIALWQWAMDNAPDGNLSDIDKRDIPLVMGWEGDRDDVTQSLIDAGFLDYVDGVLVLHEWEQHAGKIIRRDAHDALLFNGEWLRIRQQVITRDGLVCGICSGLVEVGDVHIDHIQPRSKGGSNDLANLRVTHSTCNLRRGNRD